MVTRLQDSIPSFHWNKKLSIQRLRPKSIFLADIFIFIKHFMHDEEHNHLLITKTSVKKLKKKNIYKCYFNILINSIG